MPTKTKLQITLTLMLAAVVVFWATRFSRGSWVEFLLLLAAVLLTSRFKISLPRGDGSLSLSLPFILLGVTQLSPIQLIVLTVVSVGAQWRFRVLKMFSAMQIVFNVANALIAASAAYVVFGTLRHMNVGMAPALSLSSVAFFLCNTISIAGVIAASKNESAVKVWRKEFPWYLPFYIVGAALAAIASWTSSLFGWTTALLLIPMVYAVYRAYTGQMARLKDRQQHLDDVEALHLRTIEGLAMAIEAKDQGTHDHLFRVRSYVSEIGTELNLEKVDLQALETAAFLHDIGKLAVPEHIINKPGKLSPEEFEKMKIHPVVGADILERVRFPYPVVPIVRSHHEWWDGSGYPDGLRGQEIPIGARILTVVDCFDALVSDRPYRKGMSGEAALAVVRDMSGKQFDPEVVEAFERQYHRLQEQIEETAPPVFVPLKTDFEVANGNAPGAGFEKESELSAKIRSIPGDESKTGHRNTTGSLHLIAAASQEAQTLFEMSQSLGNSLSLNETISVMASRLHRLVPFDSCVLYLKQGEAVLARFTDGENASCFAGQTISMGDGISGWVAQSGKAILNGNALVESGCPADSPLRSALSMPLFDLKQELFAVLTLYSIAADSFRRDHLRVLQAMESKLALSVQNALNFRRVEHDAETDYLTKLPNARRLFLELEAELEIRRRSEDRLGVVVCDLNAFKQVNDTRGHLIGNMLLELIADAFLEISGDSETVARVGGDEFVFLVPDMDENNASKKLRTINRAVEEATQKAGLGIAVTASVGAALYPTEATNAEDLLALADRRMYLDKEAHHRSAKPASNTRLMEAFAVHNN